MINKLSSKERLLLTINHQKTDYVPISFLFHPPLFNRWKNQFERADELLSLEVDDTLKIAPPSTFFYPEVKIKFKVENSPDENYPLLIKEYETPKGKLTTVVKKTDDWPHGNDIPLFSDFNIPRAKKFLITEESDLNKISFLFGKMDGIEKDKFYEEVKQIKKFAEKRQLLIEGWQIWGGDTACWLCGIENLIFISMDKPEFMEEIMDFMGKKALETLDILLTIGVDLVVRRGWYETTDFWSPTLYERFFAPLLKKEIEMCHQANVKFGYTMSTGIMPLLQSFKNLGIDLLYFIDPVQGKVDLKELKEKVGDTICLRGGVNSWITVEMGSKQEIDNAVRQAISILAPGGGFILSAVDAIGMQPNVWDKVLMMIESWKKYRVVTFM